MLRHNRIDRKHRIILAILAGILVVSAIGIAISQHTYHRNLATLLDLQAQNQADTIFRSDSQQKRLVEYFDFHRFTPHGLLNLGRIANDRLLAHYLLGRAYADMGDAPMAITEYKTAVECVNMKHSDCNYATLRSVYGQMAYIYSEQNLPDEQLKALRMCERCELLLEDTLKAIGFFARQMDAFYMKSDTDSVMYIAAEMRRRYAELGFANEATHFMGTPISIYLDRGLYPEAKSLLSQVQANPIIFESINTPAYGRELYYYYMGECYEGFNRMDSAEYCYRKVLEYGYHEAGYRGLLSIYHTRCNSDSIAKYSRLYCDANDYSHDHERTNEVERVSKLYDFSVQQKIASDKERETRYLRIGIIALVLASLAIYRYMRRQQVIRQLEISKLLSELEVTQLKRKKAEDELSFMIEDANKQHNNRQSIIEDKQDEVKAYSNMEEEISRKLELSGTTDFIDALGRDINVKRLHALAKPSPHPQPPTETDWADCIDACRPRLNSLIDLILQEQSLNIRDKRTCILVLLNFRNKEIMVLLNYNTRQALNDIKKKINHHLFMDSSARTLRDNLLDEASKTPISS